MSDTVNKPAHYANFSVETIDFIQDTLGKQGLACFCLGNAIKYISRSPFKGSELEDLLKAKVYLNWAKGLPEPIVFKTGAFDLYCEERGLSNSLKRALLNITEGNTGHAINDIDEHLCVHNPRVFQYPKKRGTVVWSRNGDTIYYSKAKCHKDDTFTKKIGYRLARERFPCYSLQVSQEVPIWRLKEILEKVL